MEAANDDDPNGGPLEPEIDDERGPPLRLTLVGLPFLEDIGLID